MDTTAEVLLIVVSSALTVFLIVLVVAIVYVIKILNQVKRITEQAENAVDSVQSAAAAFERSASPLAVLKLVGKIVSQASKYNKKRGK
jgi:predicted PurR-regulated permease PerM